MLLGAGALRRTHDAATRTGSLFEDSGEIRREWFFGCVALVLTFVFFAGAEWHTVSLAADAAARNVPAALLALVFAMVLLTLLSGSVLYQACRFGFLKRVAVRDGDRFPGERELLGRHQAPSVLML